MEGGVMSTRICRRIFTGLALASFAALSTVGSVSAESVNLKLSVETPQGDPLNVMLRAFAESLENRVGDQVSIEIFDGGVLGDEIAQMELVRAGEVDVVPMGSDVVEIDKHFAIFDMPFLFPDAATAHRALDGELGTLLASSLREAAGVEVLAFGELGFRVISNNKRPINTPDDLQGLKLRTPGSKTRILAFQELGAAPTPMNLGEVYLALKQGALDGQENPLSVVKEFSFFEVQKYISITRHVYTPITLTMHGKTWDALSAELKEAAKAAAVDAAAETRRLSAESDATLVSEFEAQGVAVNQADVESFKAVTGPIYEKIGEVAGPDFVEKTLAAIN
jgi:tripartite ATP-independent transporter DctP family solute receptor